MDMKSYGYDYLPQAYRHPEFAGALQAFQGTDLLNLTFDTEFQQHLIPANQNLIPPDLARAFGVPVFSPYVLGHNDLSDQGFGHQFQQYQQQQAQQQQQQQQAQQQQQQQHSVQQQAGSIQQQAQPQQYSAGWNAAPERGASTATSQLQGNYGERQPPDASRMSGQMPGLERMQQTQYPGLPPMLDPSVTPQNQGGGMSNYAGTGSQISMPGPGAAAMGSMAYQRGYGYPDQPQSYMPPYYYSNPSMCMPPGAYPYPTPGSSYLTTSVEPQQPGTSKATELASAAKASECQDLDDGDDAARALKRPRLVWTPQLHKRFEESVQKIGVDKAVPKTIMKIMNVEGLTRENVASHLQKYRLQMKRAPGDRDGSEALGTSQARGSPTTSFNGADS